MVVIVIQQVLIEYNFHLFYLFDEIDYDHIFGTVSLFCLIRVNMLCQANSPHIAVLRIFAHCGVAGIYLHSPSIKANRA